MFLTVSRPKRRWSSLERSQLATLAAQGVPTAVIARRLGRTALAVRLMAFRAQVRLAAGRPRGNAMRLRALTGAALPPNQMMTASMEASVARMAARYRIGSEGMVGAASPTSEGA